MRELEAADERHTAHTAQLEDKLASMEKKLAEAASTHTAALTAAEVQAEKASGVRAEAAEAAEVARAEAVAQLAEANEAAEVATADGNKLRENLGLVVEKYTALRESARCDGIR